MAKTLTADQIRAKELSAFVVEDDSRICFGIKFFDDEALANEYGEIVKRRGDTYNGGYMHGVPCGRDKGFDKDDKETGKRLYAVTIG